MCAMRALMQLCHVDASLINRAACCACVASALPTAWLADLSALAASQGECGFGLKRECACF